MKFLKWNIFSSDEKYGEWQYRNVLSVYIFEESMTSLT